MDFIKWDTKYELNIQEIDSQHRSLFRLVNRLHESLESTSTHLEIKDVLDELINYTKIHFRFEELFFARISFPAEDKELHKLEHRNFYFKITEFQQQLAKNEDQLSITVLEFLKDWLSHHILITDMVYKEKYLLHGLDT
jgi:hemerythrin-like metal-binding protein